MLLMFSPSDLGNNTTDITIKFLYIQMLSGSRQRTIIGTKEYGTKQHVGFHNTTTAGANAGRAKDGRQYIQSVLGVIPRETPR